MFLIVEIVNDKGEKDWKVAPKRWVCTSKNTQRPVLFWPHEFSAERQNQLAIEGTCKPLQSWMRRECVVRQEFPTYEAANTELQALLSQNSNQIKEELEDPLNVEDPAFESPGSPCTPGSDEDASTLASIKSMLQSLITKSAQLEKQNADVVERITRIESIICILQKRVDTVESKFTNSLSVLSVDNSWYEAEEAKQFSFEPMETIEQLTLLDVRLNDKSFNTELVKWLLSNVDEDTTRKRISSCMDLLCTLELQSKLKWACLVSLHNFLLLVKEIGDTPSERITLTSLGHILRCHLISSKQRIRNSLNHDIFPKKRTRPIERSGNDNSSKRTFVFKPRETAEELRDLETKLNDESFNAELLQWLLFNVNDDNVQWRIKSCLDLLCSLELQSKLRWSRRFGSITKEPIDELPNFVHLFKLVGKTPSEDVTHQGLAQCFMNHLKNSKQRYLLSLNRKRLSKWKRSTKKGKSNGVASIRMANSSIAGNKN
ncbi:uncharacterized protein LOC126571746 isoform X2 [Anopheles aquasalis]|uniref:uncharacterized protein LOC126571746 isoform X2 n=1 Tax=Anopheles aquasalis TaxID=42839 RepID=UPI00215A6747|nr:uncharacterized protein LOC126571746 isoform X2 [Anopheles aquasalis]